MRCGCRGSRLQILALGGFGGSREIRLQDLRGGLLSNRLPIPSRTLAIPKAPCTQIVYALAIKYSL